MVNFENKKITKSAYTKRTPGLYKLEFSGDGMLCLNSKVYHIWGFNNKGELICKTSSKGMQTRNNLIKKDFLDVLLKRTKHRVQNAGFITRTYTYTQDKQGLNYFYCKRVVLEDGINTTYLEI